MTNFNEILRKYNVGTVADEFGKAFFANPELIESKTEDGVETLTIENKYLSKMLISLKKKYVVFRNGNETMVFLNKQFEEELSNVNNYINNDDDDYDEDEAFIEENLLEGFKFDADDKNKIIIKYKKAHVYNIKKLNADTFKAIKNFANNI